MSKPKSGRKVKLSQSIALAPDYRDTLEEHKVIKGPVVPRFEQLDKYIVGRGWKLSFEDGAGDDEGASATIRTPGGAGKGVYEATGETAAHAITYALCDALRAEPKQADLFDQKAKQAPVDPTGADTPLFRGNGGVASVAEMELVVNGVKDRIRAGEVPGLEVDDDGAVHGIDPDPDEIEFDDEAMDLEDQLDDMLAAAGDVDPELVDAFEDDREWRFLFIVDPADIALWKASPPMHDGMPVVEWEEGGPESESDRGWYIDPVFDYSHTLGEIKLLSDESGDLLVWSREATTAESKPAKKSGKKQETNTAQVDVQFDPDRRQYVNPAMQPHSS